jgi:hypothetical protein
MADPSALAPGLTITLVQASVREAEKAARAKMVHRNFRILSFLYNFADL